MSIANKRCCTANVKLQNVICGSFYQNFFKRHQKLSDMESNDATLLFILCAFPFNHTMQPESKQQYGPVRRRQILSSPLQNLFSVEPAINYNAKTLQTETFLPDTSKLFDVTDDIMATIELYLNLVIFIKRYNLTVFRITIIQKSMSPGTISSMTSTKYLFTKAKLSKKLLKYQL